jgi:hypothetical protein
MKYIKLFENFLNENKMYITANEVPNEILNWAKDKIGNTFASKISIITENPVEINMPWHEADREYYQFFKLIDAKTAKIAGDEMIRSGMEGDGAITGDEVDGKVNIPSGFVLACVGTHPKRLELHTSDDTLKPITDSNILDGLSITELLILLQAKGLKSQYRQKFKDEYYDKLIKAGYLASNRSITVNGKNLANMPEVKDKLENYAKEHNKYFNGYQLR